MAQVYWSWAHASLSPDLVLTMRLAVQILPPNPVSNRIPAVVQRTKCSSHANSQCRRHLAAALGLSAWAEIFIQGQKASAYGGSKLKPTKAPIGTCTETCLKDDEECQQRFKNCRLSILSDDEGGLESYDKSTNQLSIKLSTRTLEQNTEYGVATRSLISAIRSELEADPFDPQRATLIEKVKKDGGDWVSKYASGGKTNIPSASRVYTAVSEIGGWIAFNGLAPLPKLRRKKLLEDLVEAEDLLSRE